MGIEADRDALLEFHALLNYVSASPWATRAPYEQFRDKWLGTSQVTEYLTDLADSMKDDRTIAEIWEVDDEVAGYMWAVFNDVPEYDFTFIELKDIAVASEFRRRGIASAMVDRIQQHRRARGAKAVYSSSGWENEISREFHARLGFRPREMRFEKLLVPEDQL